jgi:hypothetical protein
MKMRTLLLFLAIMLLTSQSNAQDFLGQKESVLKKKTSLQKTKPSVKSPTTYVMKEGTRTFSYYINRNTGTADGLTITFTTVTDRKKYLSTLVDKKKWTYVDTSKNSIRGMPSKDLQVTAYVQEKHPDRKAGAVIFSVTQTPVRQKKLSRSERL